MMYPYMTLGDETEIVHSQVIEQDGVEKVYVHFERPTQDGFDAARCELPTYTWVMRDGFTDDEMELFAELVRSNAHLIYRYARSGGIRIA